MKIIATIKPTPAFAAVLKSRSSDCGSSLTELVAAGMGSLAADLQAERQRPIADFMAPLEASFDPAEVNDRPAGAGWFPLVRVQELTLEEKAIHALGFRCVVAKRRAKTWIAAITYCAATAKADGGIK